MDSKTPQTDSAIYQDQHGDDCVDAAFARQLEKEKSQAECRQLGLAYDVQYLRGEIQRAIDYAGGRESEWGERAEGAFAILYAALSVPANEACADTHRLNSGTILLSVNGERVHFVAQDLRSAIDEGMGEVENAANYEPMSRSGGVVHEANNIISESHENIRKP